VLTCLLATSTHSSDLSSGYDSDDGGSDAGYGARPPAHGGRNVTGGNEWTPVGPGPSGGDRVYQNRHGAKTLVAGSPTSAIAESINYYGPPPSPAAHPGYRYGPPVGHAFETNQIHHHETHHVPTKTITNTIHVPVPQPYKVVIDKKVPYEVKVPVRVPKPRPVRVDVPRPVEVPVDKPYEVIVERKVPYEVRVPVEVPVRVPYHVDVPQPYPVPIPVPRPIIVKHPVPVVIKFIKTGSKGLFG